MALFGLFWNGLFCLNAFATAPTIAGITGVSAANLTGTVTAFGGLAGTDCSASADNINACNNCAAAYLTCATAPLCACNTARIYDSLVITITITPPTGSTGIACIQGGVSGGTKTPIQQSGTTNNGTYVSITWSQICTLMGGTSCSALATANQLAADIWITKSGTCTAPAAGEDIVTMYFKVLQPAAANDNYNVYGNTATDGVGGFTPYPGDGQIYVENLQTSTNFPTLSYGPGTKAVNVRVFISPNSLDDANYQSPPVSPQDLSVVDGGNSLEKNIVDGLTNDTRYFFRVAMVDEGNNVVQYFPDITAGGNSNCRASPADPTQCPYSATPSQVQGLLTKDLNCFVATAAYGSSLEPKLQTFRDFRHRYLLTNAWGQAFVRWYYRHGPYAAQFIYDKPILRAFVRGALWPLYGFSYLALKLGFGYAVAIAFVLLTALVTGPLWALRGRVPARG